MNYTFSVHDVIQNNFIPLKLLVFFHWVHQAVDFLQKQMLKDCVMHCCIELPLKAQNLRQETVLKFIMNVSENVKVYSILNLTWNQMQNVFNVWIVWDRFLLVNLCVTRIKHSKIEHVIGDLIRQIGDLIYLWPRIKTIENE